MILEIKQGANVLDAPECQFIMQQCNCYTIKPHGLSEQIAWRFPYANIYGMRRPKTRNCALDPDTPGTIKITGRVIHLFAQVLPGLPNQWTKAYPKTAPRDSAMARQQYFRECLRALEEELTDDTVVIAVPFGIGCGLAGGDWPSYLEMLTKSKLSFVLYKL
jgi:hypothetical protein